MNIKQELMNIDEELMHVKQELMNINQELEDHKITKCYSDLYPWKREIHRERGTSM